MKTNNLFEQFLELSENIAEMKKQRYGHLRAYYQKHFGKETFRQAYYDVLKSDFERIVKFEKILNRLSEVSPMLFTIADRLRTLKKEKQQAEYVQLWIPLVPQVRNLGNCYFINLLNMEGYSDE